MDVYARWLVLSLVLLASAWLVSLVPGFQSWVAPSVGVVAAKLVSVWLPAASN